MAGILEIIRAWKKANNPSEEEMRIAEERLKVCTGCEELKESFGFTVCGRCYCFIDKKIFSDSKDGCPLGYWKL